MTKPKEYERLISMEARHWGEVRFDPQNPQIWHDPGLFEIFFGNEYRRLVRTAVSAGPRILELGCGEGRLAIELASQGMDVTAIDLSVERIERAQAAASGMPNPPKFTVGDLNTITLPRSAFDCVVAHDSLHHILMLDRLCDEVRSALRPEGQFLVIDYVGMGILRKLFAGFLYAVLPTYQPYSAKWKLRRRLSGFLASEKQKRRDLADGKSNSLHEESPFEEISQASIVHEIGQRFTVREMNTFCPFWYYLAAKIRVFRAGRYRMARVMKAFDTLILRLHLAPGAYVWIHAQKSN